MTTFLRPWGLLLWVIASVWVPALASAGPWTRPPGRGYGKLSLSIFRAAGFRDSSGRLNTAARYGSLTTAVYGEVGVLPDLHVQAYVPVVHASNDFSVAPNRAFFCRDATRLARADRTSLGDGVVAIQYTPGLLDVAHALRVESKWPLYDPTAPGGPCGLLFPQPGDGQVDVSALLSLGDSFDEGRWFAFAELGHRHRTKWYLWGSTGRGFSETFLASGQAGLQYEPGAFLMLLVRLELPYQADAFSRGALLIAPAWAIPLAGGFALELELGFLPWARNGAAGEAASLFLSQGSAGISTRF